MLFKTIILLTVFGIVTGTKTGEDWTYYTGIIIAASACYAVTYFRDAKDINRLDIKYTLSCSIAASYLAYILWPDMKDFEMDLIIYRFHPFNKVQIFVGICSYFGVNIFKEANSIKNFGWKEWLAKIGDKLKAISEKK